MAPRHQRQTRPLSGWAGATGLVMLIVVASVALAGAPARVPRVAIFTPGGPSFQPVLEGLTEELARQGYLPGSQLALLVEDTQGVVPDPSRPAAQLVATHPDVLVTLSTGYTAAAQHATTQIPIVFVRVGDPLRTGLIASYASSQNNVTGIATSANTLTGKRLELFQEIAPRLTRLLALVAPHEVTALEGAQQVLAAAQKLGITVVRRDVTTREEIAQVLRDLSPGAVDGLYHVPSTLVSTNMDLLIAKAQQAHLPLIVHEDDMVDAGALISYGANSRLMGRQAARLVVQLLRGTPPPDLPIQTPDQFFLAVNLTTAKTIGLTIPTSILERADRWVE